MPPAITSHPTFWRWALLSGSFASQSSSTALYRRYWNPHLDSRYLPTVVLPEPMRPVIPTMSRSPRGRCEWLAMSRGFYPSWALRHIIKPRGGQDLCELRVIKPHGSRHNEIVLFCRAQGDVIVGKIEQAHQGRCNCIDFVMRDGGGDEISRDAGPKESTFKLFQAGLFAGDAENVLRCSRITFDHLASGFAKCSRELYTAAGEHLHTRKQAPKHGNAHSLERKLALAIDGHTWCAVAFRQGKRRIDRHEVRPCRERLSDEFFICPDALRRCRRTIHQCPAGGAFFAPSQVDSNDSRRLSVV